MSKISVFDFIKIDFGIAIIQIINISVKSIFFIYLLYSVFILTNSIYLRKYLIILFIIVVIMVIISRLIKFLIIFKNKKQNLYKIYLFQIIIMIINVSSNIRYFKEIICLIRMLLINLIKLSLQFFFIIFLNPF